MKNVKDQPKAGDRKTQVRWVNPSWVVTVFVRKENEIGGFVWVVSQEKAFKGDTQRKKPKSSLLVSSNFSSIKHRQKEMTDTEKDQMLWEMEYYREQKQRREEQKPEDTGPKAFTAFAQIPDLLLRKRLSEFRDYLPENRREQFTYLVVASYLTGKD